MNTRTKILLLAAGLVLPVVALRSQSGGVPPVSVCGGCLCIPPLSVVTIPDGQCGVTIPGGDTITAAGGPVTVSTDAISSLTAVVTAAGAVADVDVVSGPAAFALIGGGGATAYVTGSGLSLSVQMPDGDVVLTGAGNVVHDTNAGPRPTHYESTWPGPVNTLHINGHSDMIAVGDWTLIP
jgi:hypothetical protein